MLNKVVLSSNQTLIWDSLNVQLIIKKRLTGLENYLIVKAI